MTEERERLHLDVFPAEVFAPNHAAAPQAKARVFVTDRRVVVWVRGPDGPVTLIDEALASEPPERNRGTFRGQLHLETATGPVNVTRAGCKCGMGTLGALEAPARW